MILKDLDKFKLPDESGVYFFMGPPLTPPYTGGEENILYIGKATSLKSRVKSYFDNNILHTRGLHIANMVSLAKSIKFETTRSVLEALLLEQELIKKHKPKFNSEAKDDKSFFVLVITKEDFPRVLLVRNKDIDKENNLVLKSKLLGKKVENKKEIVKVEKTFGPYSSGQSAKDALKLIRKIFPFRDKCDLYDKKKSWQKKACFSYSIGLCLGTCAGVISKTKYQNHIERLITFLEGDGEKVRKDLEKDMQTASDKLEFEEAQRIKEILFALEHIRDSHLINRDIKEENKSTRIEAFDIAHMSGQNRVGVMVVVQGGVPNKSQYKKFKISKDENDDLEGLKELFLRRIKHLEWGIPDVVIVDGDERHINVAEKILIENNLDKTVKVVAVTKNRQHKAQKITGDKKIVEEFQREITLANSEAHRFAITYHKNLRKKSFIPKN